VKRLERSATLVFGTHFRDSNDPAAMLRLRCRRRFHVRPATMSIATPNVSSTFRPHDEQRRVIFFFYKRLTDKKLLRTFSRSLWSSYEAWASLRTRLCVRRDFHSPRLSQSVLVSLFLSLSLCFRPRFLIARLAQR